MDNPAVLNRRTFNGALAPLPIAFVGDGGTATALIVASIASCVISAIVFVMVFRRRQVEANLADSNTRIAFADRRVILLALSLGYALIAIALFFSLYLLLASGMVILALCLIGMSFIHSRQNTLYTQLARAETLQRNLDAAIADSTRKGHLLKTLAHDLRNPLGAVTLHAELARMKLAKAEVAEVDEALDLIYQCATETKQILSDFLEVSRMQWDEESVNIASVDATRLLHEIAGTVAPQASAKGLTIKSVIQPDVSLFTDRSKLYRIILNLIGNAVKYTSKGEVGITLESDQNMVTIIISDTGPGISEEKLPMLFDEFYQVADGDHDPRDGFGLGLTITQKLVQQLGGAITVDSKVGKGSMFTVCVPRSFAAPRKFHHETSAPAA